jgi:hypothetical protein
MVVVMDDTKGKLSNFLKKGREKVLKTWSEMIPTLIRPLYWLTKRSENKIIYLSFCLIEFPLFLLLSIWIANSANNPRSHLDSLTINLLAGEFLVMFYAFQTSAVLKFRGRSYYVSLILEQMSSNITQKENKNQFGWDSPSIYLWFFKIHLRAIKRNIDSKTNGFFKELVRLKQIKKGINKAEILDYDAIKGSLMLDLIILGMANPEDTQTPFRSYHIDYMTKIVERHPSPDQWIDFLIARYRSIDVDTIEAVRAESEIARTLSEKSLGRDITIAVVATVIATLLSVGLPIIWQELSKMNWL